mgnify:CR=1 FL=1
MKRISRKRVLALIAALFFATGTLLQGAMPVFAEEAETDITDKVTIDSITSSNAEIKDSTNTNDFSSFVPWGGRVDYKIDMTVNKGTPIQTGDIIEIPVKADRGRLFESHGLSVLDSEDGSLLGEATITADKIRIRFTKKNNTKTAAKLTIQTTLKDVGCEFSNGFPTQAEVDAAKAAHPTGIDKVKILDKNVNINVQSNYWLSSSQKYYKDYPVPAIGDPAKFGHLEHVKSGRTSATNISTHWAIDWNRPAYRYNVTSPTTGKVNPTTMNSSALAAMLFGEDKAYALFSATEISYVEDTLPADIYKNIKLSGAALNGAGLHKDSLTPILKQSVSDGKYGDCSHIVEGATFKFDDVFTKKEPASGQSYEQFKSSLKPGEYGIYKSPNGDIRLVASLGKLGSKEPGGAYTFGDLAAKVGKDTVVKRLVSLYDITADGDIKRVDATQDKIEAIYNKIKDWPITRCAFDFDADLAKPVMRTGSYVENTAVCSGEPRTGKNTFIVGEISLYTYKDGAAILKTDARTGQGIAKAEFKLQEKDPAGNWIDTDSQYVKDSVTIVGSNGGSKTGDRLYTNENGILNIRGLTNGKTYRLVETKAPKGMTTAT